MHRATYRPGEFIFREGDESSEAYWVLSGRVEISMETPQGRSVLTILEEGEIFGEMGMIDDLPRTASARALSDTELDVVNERDFRYEILRDEARLLPYLDMLFERLRSTNAMLRAEIAKRRSSEPSSSARAALSRTAETAKAPALEPSPALIRSTERSAHLYPDGLQVEIRKFPFRIGRMTEHESLSSFGRADLAVPDQRPHSVSRGHCLIEHNEHGYFVRDCGSRLGTIVNGVSLGAEATETTAPLRHGENRIILGTPESLHEYLVTVG